MGNIFKIWSATSGAISSLLWGYTIRSSHLKGLSILLVILLNLKRLNIKLHQTTTEVFITFVPRAIIPPDSFSEII